MATKNLFSKAKSVAPKTKVKDEKVRVNLNDFDFFNKVSTLEMLQDRMKSDKAQADMLSDEIKDLSKEEWVRLYDKTGKNPGSILVESQNGGQTATVMYVPSDKYISLNADRADTLIGKYGDDIIEEKTTFAFDNDMIEKYGEVLSNLIMSCNDISDDDKERIIKATTTFSVAKGTIDRMNQYGSINEVMDEIKPVISLKNVEVING
jgi:hypothetical protein